MTVSGQPQDSPEVVLALSLPSGQSSKQCPALPLVDIVRNAHIISHFIRLVRHLVIDECLFGGIRIIGCIRIDFGVGIIA